MAQVTSSRVIAAGHTLNTQLACQKWHRGLDSVVLIQVR